MSGDIVVVTGASGFVGRFVLDELNSQRVSVRALVHKTPVKGTVASVTGTLTDEQTLHTLLNGARWVIHCAFSHVQDRYRGGEGDDPVAFWQTNFGGTLALLEGCAQHNVEACSMLSSRAVFGAQTGIVDDDCATTPDTHYGALKAAEESLAAAYRASGKLSVRCVRATGVFGRAATPERNKWWPLVCETLACSPDQPLAIAPRTSTKVSGEDVANALWLSLGTAEPQRTQLASSGNLNCSDLMLTQQQLVHRIETLAGRQPRSSPGPDVPMHGPRMRCRTLTQLNWRPQGWPAVDETLTELIAHYRKLNPDTG